MAFKKKKRKKTFLDGSNVRHEMLPTVHQKKTGYWYRSVCGSVSQRASKKVRITLNPITCLTCLTGVR